MMDCRGQHGEVENLGRKQRFVYSFLSLIDKPSVHKEAQLLLMDPFDPWISTDSADGQKTRTNERTNASMGWPRMAPAGRRQGEV